MRLLTTAVVAGCMTFLVSAPIGSAAQRAEPGLPTAQGGRQVEARAQQQAAQQPIIGQVGEPQAPARDPWQVAANIAQVVSVPLMFFALIYCARQARHAAEAVRAAVSQSLTDRMIGIVQYLSEHVTVGKAVFGAFGEVDENEMKVGLAAHPFLLHFENVLDLREHLPRGQYPKYLASMEYILRLCPAIHRWMEHTGGKGVWSEELYDIATRCRPAGFVEASLREPITTSRAGQAVDTPVVVGPLARSGVGLEATEQTSVAPGTTTGDPPR